MKNQYARQYLEKEWIELRNEIIKRDENKCQDCLEWVTENTANVHHTYYVANRKVWEYPKDTLITLCKKCHKKRHKECDTKEAKVIEKYSRNLKYEARKETLKEWKGIKEIIPKI